MKEKLKATHEGELNLGEAKLDVAVLENGKRIITQSAVFKALGRPARGNSRVINIPTFMDAKNLQPLISKELYAVTNKVEYLDKNGKTQQGYDADILPLVSDLYLKARQENVLLASQTETAIKAEILVRSLARVAIVSLIDEATGYQEIRAKDALQVFLQKFLEEEKGKWVKTFPDEFFESIFRMKGWSWSIANKGKKPSVVGHYINNYVYSRIAPQVLSELKRLNPKDEKGNRKAKHPQFIDVDYGHPKLKEHLSILTAFAKASGHNWTNWQRMVERALPKFEQDGSQIQEIPFEEL
jgi:hypothetical protein